MAELPPGYRQVSEEDRKKAQVYFGYGRTVAATGNLEYAIERFLSGLRIDPDAVPAHQELREISLRRKASGGKALGMLEAMKLKKSTKDDKENLLNAERLLAFDPGNTDHMLTMVQNAAKAGYYDTVLWIGPILLQAESTAPKPDFNKVIALRDTYAQAKLFKHAAEACNYALRLRPNDMNLQVEARNLSAQQTMQGAGYDKGGSFRDQVRDMDTQLRLLDADKDAADVDSMSRQIADAEKQLEADPNEIGKVGRLVELLAKTEKTANEERAIALLQQWYDKTKQFRFRQKIGEIRMRQMQRQEQILHKAESAPNATPAAKKEYADYTVKRAEAELKEYMLWAENYPTEMRYRYEVGNRQYKLKQFDEAIGSYQQARQDPKYRTVASIMLGKAFMEAGFLDEADETLAAVIQDAANREGDKYKDMVYWRARVLEMKGNVPEAIKHYSQIFQMESGYRDVSPRIKALRKTIADAAEKAKRAGEAAQEQLKEESF